MASLNPMINENVSRFELQEEWNETIAREVAAREGVALSEAHWQVIYFLREQCDKHEGMCNARKVIRALQARFEKEGGKRYLYSLFPGGPVRQATQIAGLPMPPETLDLSFGSVH